MGASSLAQGEVLPGFDLCGVSDVPWLSTNHSSVDLAPGHSIKIPVVTEASGSTALGVHRGRHGRQGLPVEQHGACG